MLIAEEIQSFNRTTFTENLSNLTGVPTDRISVTAAAASTIVNATLRPLGDPKAVQDSLDQSILVLSGRLGVHIRDVLHAAGPLHPSPPPTHFDPADDNTDNLIAQGDDNYGMYVGLWLGGVAIVALIIYCIYELRKKQVREFCCPGRKTHKYLKEVQLEDLSERERDVRQGGASASRVNAGRSALYAGGRGARVSFAGTHEQQGRCSLLQRVTGRQAAGGSGDGIDDAGDSRARLSRVLPGSLHSRRVSRSGVSPYVVDPRERGASIAGGISSDAVGVLHSQC